MIAAASTSIGGKVAAPTADEVSVGFAISFLWDGFVFDKEKMKSLDSVWWAFSACSG